MAFARLQFEEDFKKRQRSREERRKGRQAAADLELRKIRLILDMSCAGTAMVGQQSMPTPCAPNQRGWCAEPKTALKVGIPARSYSVAPV